jgi:DNA-directed RNA polymerase specialized sigma24 family protein
LPEADATGDARASGWGVVSDLGRAVLRQLLLGGYGELKTRLAQRLGSAELAADVLQDTWLRLESAAPAGPVRQPKSYLLRIAYNIALKRRQAEHETVTLDDATTTTRRSAATTPSSNSGSRRAAPRPKSRSALRSEGPRRIKRLMKKMSETHCKLTMPRAKQLLATPHRRQGDGHVR